MPCLNNQKAVNSLHSENQGRLKSTLAPGSLGLFRWAAFGQLPKPSLCLDFLQNMGSKSKQAFTGLNTEAGRPIPWHEGNAVYQVSFSMVLSFPAQSHRSGQDCSRAGAYLARNGSHNNSRGVLIAASGWPGRHGKYPECPAQGGFWVTQNRSDLFLVPSFCRPPK